MAALSGRAVGADRFEPARRTPVVVDDRVVRDEPGILRVGAVTMAEWLLETAELWMLTKATQYDAAECMHVCVDAYVHSTCLGL